MRRVIVKLSAVVAALFIGVFALFIVNQTAQFVALADRISPMLGTVVLWTLVVFYAAAIGFVAFQYARLPKPLRPPRSKNDSDFPRYMARLRARLRRNPFVQGMPLETEADIEAALNVLGQRADDITRSSALQVFLTTAVSQNGNLDVLAVLVAQSRMVLQIARVYNQRPGVRELWSLYVKVAMAALLARQIEDMDMAETIRPLISSVITSALGVVPGMEAAVTVFVQSALTGSANAYVTLRIGVIAKRYSGSLTMPAAATVRKAAFAEALQMIPSVVQQGAKTIGSVIRTAMRKTVVNSVKNAGTATVNTAGSVSEQIVRGAREVAVSSVGSVRRFGARLFVRRGPSPSAVDEPVTMERPVATEGPGATEKPVASEGPEEPASPS